MTPRMWLGFLLLLGIALRGGLWLAYQPVIFPDTPGYMQVARAILAGDFTEYDGRRTPGYPVVLALAHLSPERVWAYQMAMGLLISALLFFIALRLTGRPGVAGAVGLTYNLNLAQLFFEGNLLAETTCTFAVTATAAVFIVTYDRVVAARPTMAWLVLLGTLSGVAVLTRPQFLFLPLLTGALVTYASVERLRSVGSSLRRAGVVVAPALMLAGGWGAFNHAQLGVFTLSSLGGIALFNHTLAFIELAPDQYTTVREIGLRHRDAKLASGGSHAASWDALPELKTATGLSLPALSRQLERMSMEMFLRHPFHYAKGVAHAWVDFWMAPLYWQPERLRPPGLGTVLQMIWRLEQPILRLANLVFVILVAAAVLSARFRRTIGVEARVAGLAALVLMTSIFQALAIWVENARYAISVQPLLILVIFVVFTAAARSMRREVAT